MKLRLATGAAIAASAVLLSSAAFAIDNGPCHKCTMDPIVVKGERPKKKAVKQPKQLTVQTGATATLRSR